MQSLANIYIPQRRRRSAEKECEFCLGPSTNLAPKILLGFDVAAALLVAGRVVQAAALV